MGTVAEVIVDIRTSALGGTFDYSVPDELKEQVKPGCRVLVSFGRQLVQGFVMSLSSFTDRQTLKPLLGVLDDRPLLTNDLLELSSWMVERYACTRLEAVSAMLPTAYRLERVTRYRLTEHGENDELENHRELVQALTKRPLSATEVVKRFGPSAMNVLLYLVKQGLAQEVTEVRDRTLAKVVTYVEGRLSPVELEAEATKLRSRAPKQATLLRTIAQTSPLALDDLGVRKSDEALKQLAKRGLVRLFDQEVYRQPQAGLKESHSKVELTSSQAHALTRLVHLLNRPETSQAVLHGVTGSGKTEVYLRLIQHCLTLGHNAIVLVPEISLTPQLLSRFAARFGELVAVLHSGLGTGERRDEWLRLHRGDARIAVGARSAIFAPLSDVGLVIIDEEHEPTYKQEESPRYDTRTVAVERMRLTQGLVVRGSATPSLEAMHAVSANDAELVALPFRVHGQPMPKVDIVDMREEMRSGNRSLFSQRLLEGLSEAVESQRQAILFLNRRGYASFVLCRNCGERLQCPNCDISLTLHKTKSGQILRCHYCDYSTVLDDVCPACHEPAMRAFGIGTQQVEQQLQEMHSNWAMLRMDVDTTRGKGGHQAILQKFANGEAQILIGTQMIAKGLDFPNVTFVGVVTADTMLAVPDYRAAERTFNLLTQVAGRAGRSTFVGKTVIQTFQPEHYAIRAAARHDYTGFYEQETELRQTFHYPPYCELAAFVATHVDERLARGACARFERELVRSGAPLHVYPTVAAGVKRVNNQYRYRVVIKYNAWIDVKAEVVRAFTLVREKMNKLHGSCSLDVEAHRII